MIYNKEQIDLYLKKMEYNDEIKIDYKTLCKLQIAHLTHIPYENIDAMRKYCKKLKKSIYRKSQYLKTAKIF